MSNNNFFQSNFKKTKSIQKKSSVIIKEVDSEAEID